MPNARDGRAWAIGTAAEIEWIQRNTTRDCTVTSAIPPVFAAYATIADLSWVVEPGDRARAEAVVESLSELGPSRWWLGYLDTGGDDIVFPYVDQVRLYARWRYVLVEAGAEEALAWRDTLPDLMFPIDRSWLVSSLWDDTWTCVGGPTSLHEKLHGQPGLDHRTVLPGELVSPPGHTCI